MLLLETKRTVAAFSETGRIVSRVPGRLAMKSVRRFFSRMRRLVGRQGPETRLREEIAEHLALATADNLRAGMPPIEARRQAMVKFGGVEAMREEYRAAGGLMMIENIVQDVRYAIRSLERTPGLTAFVIFTLALGIGMTAGTFSMGDALIFRPYPVPRRNDARQQFR